MRILQIEKFLDHGSAAAGGVGRYVQSLSERLRGRGHEVFSFGCGGADGMVEFFDFNATRNPLALLRMIHNRRAAEKLGEFLRRTPVDVAHLHNIYHHLTPSILPVLAGRGVGIVMTLHDYRLLCPARHFYRPGGLCTQCCGGRYYHAAGLHCGGVGGAGLAIESYVQHLARRYYRWVDFFLCPTHYMRDMLLKGGAPAGKLVVVRNLIADDIPADIKPGDDSEPTLLFAGRLGPEKAPRMMLDLAAALPRVKIILAGNGPEMDSLKAELRPGKLKNVELLGHVSAGAMGGLYASASAVVLTSRCMENSPATMLEAMSAGLCVIVPDQPPLREWVTDGLTGRVFTTGDAESLAKVAGEVLTDGQARRKMGDEARRMVARRHEGGAIIERTEELYETARRRCELR